MVISDFGVITGTERAFPFPSVTFPARRRVAAVSTGKHVRDARLGMLGILMQV
jgi:hypothetical protein